MQRVLAALLAASVLVVVGPAGEAEACSCAPLDPVSSLEQADAAFIGRLARAPDRPLDRDAFTGVWVFEVTEWVKGDLGPEVGVHAALDGAACGFEMAVGQEAGIFLHNDGGRPTGGLCSTTTPEALRAATTPLAFDGEGPPVFLLAGETGRTRLVTLDASARLLAATGDDDWGWGVSVCPGRDFLVDVVGGQVFLRDMATLEAASSVPFPPGQSVEQAWCLSPDGGELVLLGWDDAGENAVLTVVGKTTRRVYQGPYHHVAVGASHAAVMSDFGGRIVVFDLADGSRAEVIAGAEVSRLEFAPESDRLLVAAATFHDDRYATTLTVHDGSTGELIFESEPFEGADSLGWLTGDRLGLVRYDMDDPMVEIVDITDGSVTATALTGWNLHPLGESYVSFEGGALVVGSPHEGEIARVTLPFPSHRLVAVLDPGAEVDLPAAPATSLPPIAAPSPNDPPTPVPGVPPLLILALGAAALGLAGIGIGAARRRK